MRKGLQHANTTRRGQKVVYVIFLLHVRAILFDSVPFYFPYDAERDVLIVYDNLITYVMRRLIMRQNIGRFAPN